MDVFVISTLISRIITVILSGTERRGRVVNIPSFSGCTGFES
jgi:hypothetical protein